MNCKHVPMKLHLLQQDLRAHPAVLADIADIADIAGIAGITGIIGYYKY